MTAVAARLEAHGFLQGRGADPNRACHLSSYLARPARKGARERPTTGDGRQPKWPGALLRGPAGGRVRGYGLRHRLCSFSPVVALLRRGRRKSNFIGFVDGGTDSRSMHEAGAPGDDAYMTPSTQSMAGISAVGLYRVDPTTSSITFKTRHLFGLGRVRGRLELHDGKSTSLTR